MRIFLYLLLVLLVPACKTYEAKTYDFPKPVDTTTRPITLQTKKTYALPDGIYADNLFDGARLNNIERTAANKLRADIDPENTPINRSPYYAFRLWSDDALTVELELNYSYSRHRYPPKISRDGETWELLPEDKLTLAADSVNAFLQLELSSDTLWVAAQELQTSKHVQQWCEIQRAHPAVQLSSIGKSREGRDLWCLDIGVGDSRKKDVIVVLGRQHPPEVTGWFAMKAFVEELLAEHQLAQNFVERYRILVFPLLNPDGVDLGHWRHNTGGIDLNRDWGYYNQPEVRNVANYVVETVGRNRSNVILGLDFHSTYWDIYYTNRERPEQIPEFKDYWLMGISETLGEPTNERPSWLGGPVSKNWILTQFNAPGVTYEIGDKTPRDFIKRKGQVSAQEMMQLLIMRN